MVVCPACGSSNAEDSVVCAACNASLAPDGATVAAGVAEKDSPDQENEANVKNTPKKTKRTPGQASQWLSPDTELSHKRYKIEKAVAKGGMGAVYLAYDKHFHKPCAVKEMLDNFNTDEERDLAVQWFAREASILLELNHPAIPRVRDYFEENGRHYLVMDYIDGRTLSKALEEDAANSGGLGEDRVRSWAVQLCSVLGYLHAQHPPIIFRDLKPQNIMVMSDDRIKLIDFGIARPFQVKQQATVVMTLGYAPPEQLQGMPEPRSDIFALGATLHRLLTKHDPNNNKPTFFDFPPVRTIRPEISIGLDQILDRALRSNVTQRWVSAAEMEKALLNLPPLSKLPPVQQPPVFSQPRVSQPPLTSNPAGQRTIPPEQIQGMTQSAQNLIAQRQFSAALGLVNQILPYQPNNYLLHKMAGQALAMQQRPDPLKAYEAYQNALRLSPNDPEIHKLIGDVFLFLQRRPADAITAYQNAIKLKATEAEYHFLIGTCYEQLNQLDVATNAYKEALRLLPSFIPAHMQLGMLYLKLNQLPGAEREFVEVLKLDPNNQPARYNMAVTYARQNRLADAVRECQYAVNMNPMDQQAQMLLRQLTGNNPGGSVRF